MERVLSSRGNNRKLRERWEELPKDASFFYKLRNISRFYRQISKLKARENRKVELDTKAKLEVATTALHDDIHNFDKQIEVERLRHIIGEIDNRKTRRAAVRTRVKWQQVGDRYSVEFSKSVRQKNAQAHITELKDK